MRAICSSRFSLMGPLASSAVTLALVANGPVVGVGPLGPADEADGLAPAVEAEALFAV